MRYGTCLVFSICLLFASSAYSQEATVSSATQTVNLKPSYMAMFKNGLGLVTSRAELPKSSGLFQVTPLPDSTLGSFWVSWPEDITLSQIKATQVQEISQVVAVNIPEILQGNIGKTLWMQIYDPTIAGPDERQDHRLILAKIVDVPTRRFDYPFIPFEGRFIPPPQPPQIGQIVVLEFQGQQMVVPIDWIKSVRSGVDTDKPNLMAPQTGIQPVVQFIAEGTAATPVPVDFTFMSKGVSWSPSYIVDISNEKNAKISAKAVIVNDLLPLEDTRVELIAGYPHIQFSETPDAFTLTPLQQILEQLGRSVERVRADVTSNRMVTRQMFAGAAVMEADMAPNMPSTPVQGETTEDLFFYQIDKVTLKKGERGYYPLFSAEVPYEHLYTWEIPDAVANNEYYQGIPPEVPQDVWHTLKLTNNTETPWTTAPATTAKENRVLGQDTIKYTPPGAQTDLKITKAASLQAEHNEFETNRQRAADIAYNINYDLVTVRGELALTNYSDKAVKVEIAKTITGEVQQAAGDPKIQQLARGLRMVNPRSKMVWTLDVQPGKDNALRLEYVYQVFVRS